MLKGYKIITLQIEIEKILFKFLKTVYFFKEKIMSPKSGL